MSKIAWIKPRLSLSSRLSLALFLLLLVFTAIQYYSLSYFYKKAIREEFQRVHWEIAHDIAAEIQPLVSPTLDEEALLNNLLRIIKINPRIDLALLDGSGKIEFVALSFQSWVGRYSEFLSNYSGEGFIDTKRIEHFLQLDPSRKLPILGDGIIKRFGEQKVFSAARLELRGNPGYLYVVLDSSKTTLFQEAMEVFYLITGTLMTSAIILLITSVIGLITFRTITRRFRTMTEQVNRIAAGQLEVKVEDRGSDEVAQFGKDINKMAGTIISNMRAAEEADTYRRNMIAALSHDLGSPLATIMSYSSQLVSASAELAEDEKLKRLEVISRNSETVARLVKDLLELSKLQRGLVELNLEPLPIVELITEEVLPVVEAAAARKSISIETDFEHEFEMVQADFALLCRVLVNLLENAVRYNKENGTVLISTLRRNGKVEISVADTGNGIPEEERGHIFSQFYRGTSSSQSSAKGSGLGLWIVKTILELHDSTIEVSGRPDGEGSVFRFELPRDA